MAVPALVLTAGGTALALVFRWGWAANRDLMGDNRAFADVFVARGPAAAYALCALAVGALTVLLLRRALPALAVSVAAMWLLDAVPERCRDRLWPAETRTAPKPFELPDDAWRLEWDRPPRDVPPRRPLLAPAPRRDRRRPGRRRRRHGRRLRGAAPPHAAPARRPREPLPAIRDVMSP